MSLMASWPAPAPDTGRSGGQSWWRRLLSAWTDSTIVRPHQPMPTMAALITTLLYFLKVGSAEFKVGK